MGQSGCLDVCRAAARPSPICRSGGLLCGRGRIPPAGASLMLIGAFACAHTPQLLIRPPTEDRELVLRVHAAFARVKERLTALRPDVIAIIGGGPIAAVLLDAVPPPA